MKKRVIRPAAKDTRYKDNYVRYPVPLPDIVSMDVIAAMQDDELMMRLRTLHDDRDKVFAERLDARLWDVELAYVKREQQVRKTRHDAHEKYLLELAKEHAEQEIGLPNADTDNSTFVNANAQRSN